MKCNPLDSGVRAKFVRGAGVLMLVASAAFSRQVAFTGVQPEPPATTPSQTTPEPARTPTSAYPAVAPPTDVPSEVPAPKAGSVELFPGIRVDRQSKTVEIDGVVPIDAHQFDRKTGARLHIFLEVVLCPFDTKEHETLVATTARPSNIHAALLLLGLEPGKPGSWTFDEQTRTLKEIPPEGPALDVTIVWTDEKGEVVELPAEQLVERVPGGGTLTTEGRESGWVFAGSAERQRLGETYYAADAEGTAVGLATFGTETVAWRSVYSPEDAVSKPQWAASSTLPARGTKVVVRIAAK